MILKDLEEDDKQEETGSDFEPMAAAKEMLKEEQRTELRVFLVEKMFFLSFRPAL